MESKIIFGEMIDYLRKKNDLSMEEFGNIFDKNKSTIIRSGQFIAVQINDEAYIKKSLP